MPASTKTCLCYLLSTPVSDDVYMGGAMVTDLYGLPIEFRYTEPVAATKLQRILYGDVLERYIQTDVILAHLLEHLESKPGLFMTAEHSFLSAIEGNGRIGVWLGETHSPPLSSAGAQQAVSDDEILVQLTATGAPARVRFAETLEKTSAAGKRSDAIGLLIEAANTMDVIEPMRRVEKAVKLIWDESSAAQAAK